MIIRTAAAAAPGARRVATALPPSAARVPVTSAGEGKALMSGNVTRGLCALAAGTALAAFTLVTAGAAGAAPGAAWSPAAAGTGRPAGAPGSQLWVRLYNGPGNSFDAASAVAASPGRSRVFVTGESQGTRSGPDYATVAYSASTGARLWVQRYNGFDSASAVAVSPGGSRVFVTGASQGTRSGPDYATVAYSAATGARLWVARYNGPANGDDAARSVAVSPSGSAVHVTGSSYPGSTTLAYSAATGTQLWLARHNDLLLAAVAVSPGGSRIYVTGLTGPFRYGYATVAYRAG